MESQSKVWDKIAPEWHEFKTNPSEYAQEFLKKQTGNVLDLGSGSGRNLIGLKTKAKIYLIDFSKEMLKLAKKRAKKEKVDAEFIISEIDKIPFQDNFFDSAICISALHCIETSAKRRKTIKELFRVLKPKAQAQIAVWNKNSERFKKSKKEKFINWRDKGKRFYYLYTEDELKKDLEKIGFKVIKQLPHRANIVFIIEKP